MSTGKAWDRQWITGWMHHLSDMKQPKAENPDFEEVVKRMLVTPPRPHKPKPKPKTKKR